MRIVVAVAVTGLTLSASTLSAQDAQQRNHRPPPIDWSRADAAGCVAGDLSACRKGYDKYAELAAVEARMVMDLQRRCVRDQSTCAAYVQAVDHAINSKGTGSF